VDGPAPRPHDVAVLSRDERQQATRFRSQRDASRFVARRAFVRRVLAERLDVAPGAVPLILGEHGRPVLADGAVRFSAAHSDGLAVVAVVDDGEVGVDVERMRDDVRLRDLAGRVLTTAEAAAVTDQVSLFTYWTVKEACLKAAGTGFQRPATSVEVVVDGDDVRVDGWHVTRLRAPRDGFMAALAVSSSAARPAGARSV
jgi:4'-phosphopantetheinyl transferase